MGKKAKVRFTAVANGIEAELFAIRDRGENGIVLRSNMPDQFIEGGRRVAFVEQHYSVHNTKGVDTTVTQHTLTDDGVELKLAAYIHDTKDYLLWPIYARRLGINNAITKSAVNRDKDILHRVARYETASSCLFYCVFVCNPNFDYRSIEDSSLNVKTTTIGRYRIVVLSTFMIIPSLQEGWVAGISTSKPRRNGVFDEDHFQLQRGPIPFEEMLDTFWMLMNELRDLTIRQLTEMFGDDPHFMHQLSIVSGFFSAEPFVKREQATG
jgi:hypothetical protein